MSHLERWQRAPGPIVALALLLVVLPAEGLTSWATEASGMSGVISGAAGLAVIAHLLLPRRRWPWVAAVGATTIAAMTWFGGVRDVPAVVGFGVAAAVQGVVAAELFLRFTGRTPGIAALPDFGRRRDLGAFALAACGIAAAVGAVIAESWEWWRLDTASWGGAAHHLIGHALSMAILAPLVAVWFTPCHSRRWRSPAGLTVVVGLGIATELTLGVANFPWLFAVLAGLIAVAAIFDGRTLALSVCSVAVVISVSLALDPTQPIAGISPMASLLLTKLEFLLFTLTAFLVAAEVNEHRITERRAIESQSTVGKLQALLLPPIEMEGSGYRVRGTYDPAQHTVGIGGDWYLARVAVTGHLVFAVGDMVGHDLRAAQSMAAVRSSLVLEGATNPDARALLEKLDLYAEAEPSIRFSTAWVGVYNPVNRTLDYACAGHPPPLLHTADRVYRLDRANSALVGIPQGQRTNATTFVPPGATIVLYTDGLVERRATGIEPGIRRLERTILDRGTDPGRLLEEMLADSHSEDDAAVAVIDFDRVTTGVEHDSRLSTPEQFSIAASPVVAEHQPA